MTLSPHVAHLRAGQKMGDMKYIDSMIRDGEGRLQYHYTLVDFLAEWRSGEARAGSDAAEVAWADPNDLGPYDLWSETVRMIGLGLERRSN